MQRLCEIIENATNATNATIDKAIEKTIDFFNKHSWRDLPLKASSSMSLLRWIPIDLNVAIRYVSEENPLYSCFPESITQMVDSAFKSHFNGNLFRINGNLIRTVQAELYNLVPLSLVTYNSESWLIVKIFIYEYIYKERQSLKALFKDHPELFKSYPELFKYRPNFYIDECCSQQIDDEIKSLQVEHIIDGADGSKLSLVSFKKILDIAEDLRKKMHNYCDEQYKHMFKDGLSGLIDIFKVTVIRGVVGFGLKMMASGL